MSLLESRSLGLKPDDFSRQTIIIDIGITHTRCGFSGSLTPLFVFPYDFTPYFYSNKRLSKEEWSEVVSNFFTYLFSTSIITSVHDNRVIIGHHIYAPTDFLDAICSILLNSYRVNGVYLIPSLCVIPLSFKKLTGLSISCDFKDSQSIAIVDGASLQYTLKSIPMGIWNVIQNIKELEGLESLHESTYEQLLQDALYVHNEEEEIKEDYTFYDSAYHTLSISSECRWKVLEVLFDRSIDQSSLATLICSSLLASPRLYRVLLASNICLSGPLTCLPGFIQRLYKEIYQVINTETLYSELQPLLKTLHIYIDPQSSLMISYPSLAIFTSLSTNLNYLTQELYQQQGFKDPFVEKNI